MDIQQDFHIITTDNSFYRNLGLDILTTGSLADWWDETQNRVIIENPQDDDAPRVLGERFLDDNISWMEFVPNTEHPTIGNYEEKTLEDVLVTYSDILLACYDLVDPKIKKLENLASLIKLNEIVSTVNKEKGKIFAENFPSNEVSNYPYEWQSVLTNLNLQLMKNGNELLQKIKKSKSGYIDFTANPRFIIHPYGFIVEDSVKFKLLLLDDNNSEISRPGVAINDLRFSMITNIQSGGENQQETRAGSFAATWDQSTNKYKAGNNIVYAKLIDGIGRATDNVKTETLQNQDNAQALSQPSTENQVVPATGSAIPIFSQDRNSLQLTPSYLLPADKRCSANEEEAKEKVIYEVYNYSSTRSYKKDELVLLTDIGSNKWSIMPLNEPPVEESSEAGAPNKWGPFTYFWTNSDFFFRDNANHSFTPRNAEISAHLEYYKKFDDPIKELNSSINYGKSGGYSTSFFFDTKNKIEIQILNGYFQTTSFDYLDGLILGLNTYCRISTTNPNRRPDGTQIPFDLNKYSSRNAAICGIFHGCIFPGGYNGFDEFLYNRNYKVEPNITEEFPSTEDDIRDFVKNPNSNVKFPFILGEISETGSTFNPDPSRSQCRNATFANLGEEINYDNLIWERAKDERDLSIFNPEQSLNSVPADVMLNASLSGINGSPIVPISSYKFHRDVNDENIFTPFLKNYWAKRTTEKEDGRIDAFDFRPNNPNHIMFRPLKLEAYVQLDGGSAQAIDLTKSASHNSRWMFSSEAWRTQMDYEMPISPFALFRNKYSLENDESFWQDKNFGLGPRWGGDVKNNLSYNYLHNYNYWSDEINGAMRWARDPEYVENTSNNNNKWKGAKAFGVITASKTINATNSITITTSSRCGMGAAAYGKFEINKGFENQDRTWGSDFFDDTYRQHNIIDLSMRIYHHHPAEQTIYDPRTFAVHHLNPHLALSHEHYNNSGERPTATGTITHEGSKYDIEYKEPLTDVDYRVLTDYKYENSKITPIELNVGTTVFSDVSEQSGGTYPLPEKYWALKTDRVGKLLPYRWSRKVIKYGNFSPTNSGTGYDEGDIVGNTDYGIRLSVTQTGLVVVDPGSALPRSGLCKRGQNDGTIRLSGIQTANGQGFDAGVIGIVVEEIVTDPKPLLILNNGQDITRISSDTIKPVHSTTGKNSNIEPLAIIDEFKSTLIEVSNNRSPNNKYDLFFHFHNDITMTWLASSQDFHGDRNNPFECIEQYVDLRISTS